MKKLIIAASLLASLLASLSAMGAEVLLGSWSHHLSGADVDESHEVAGVCLRDWCAGRYKNSYSAVDTFAHRRIEFYSGVVDAGFNVGVMGGYEGKGMMTEIGSSGFVFGISPYVSVGVNISLLNLAFCRTKKRRC